MRKYYLLLVFLAFLSCKKDEIKTKPDACFDYLSKTNFNTGDTITFTNCSKNATKFKWDFGDGKTSNDSTPKHHFDSTGHFKIILFASNNNTTDTISKTITIGPKVRACFDYSPNSNLMIGDTIIFSNCSENATTFIWDFGDGTTSSEKAPNHIYENKGNFIIKLSAINGNHIDTITKTMIIADQYFVDLHDTLIVCSAWRTFNFDFNKDNKTDVSFDFSTYWGSMSNHIGIQILMMNGYEIYISKGIEYSWSMNGLDTVYQYDTTIIPRLFKFNDLINIGDNHSNNIINLVWKRCNPNWMTPGCLENRSWMNSDYKYMAFIKKDENENEIVWLKIKVVDYLSVIFNSYKYFRNKDEILIDDVR